jgi:FkbM family methyltransferase
MLIDKEYVKQVLNSMNIQVRGILHVGAYECEEFSFYRDLLDVEPQHIVWMDALSEKVQEATVRGILNVFEAVLSDKDGEKVVFHQTNNGQSSSILPFGTHILHHPEIHVIQSIPKITTTLDTFFAHHKELDTTRLNFWNLDIQGMELKALQGGVDALIHADVVYIEVNTEELYEGCALLPEVDNFLIGNGFQRILTKILTQWGWGDALYIRVPT